MIKDRNLEKCFIIWYALKTDGLKVLYSTIPNRIQAAIRTNGSVTKYEITCLIFTKNEINSKIKCCVTIVLYMSLDKT